jgi:hypothetical protein
LRKFFFFFFFFSFFFKALTSLPCGLWTNPSNRHRLSTITHADQIVVLHQGAVVENGTHEELLDMKGRYASMWEKHCRAEQAAEQARAATDKAHKLLRKARLLPGHNKPQDSKKSSGYQYEAPHNVYSSPSSPVHQDGASSPDGSVSPHPSHCGPEWKASNRGTSSIGTLQNSPESHGGFTLSTQLRENHVPIGSSQPLGGEDQYRNSMGALSSSSSSSMAHDSDSDHFSEPSHHHRGSHSSQKKLTHEIGAAA